MDAARPTADEGAEATASPVSQRLSALHKYLPVWIGLAMVAGVLLGRLVPGMKDAFEAVQIDTVSLPIAIGLLWMMYPVLARVKYEEIGKSFRHWKFLSMAMFINWILGPVLMFGLAWLFLRDLEHYRNGVILVGLARCIAMVLVWNMLAGGDAEKCAILVALNSLFQIVTYSPYAYLFIGAANISMWAIAKSVFIFLGIPLIAGFLTRTLLRRQRGDEWYDQTFMPKLGPTAMVGLLFTVVVMFAMQGDKITGQPLDILRIAVPLAVFFFLVFGLTFFAAWLLRFRYPETVTLSFTAASNDFELAIAVAVATFGIASPEALATVVGPLIEVPVLLALVYVALWLRPRLFPVDGVEAAQATS